MLIFKLVFFHLTEVVWAASTELGCALTSCQEVQGSGLPQSPVPFWVCEYNPYVYVAFLFFFIFFWISAVPRFNLTTQSGFFCLNPPPQLLSFDRSLPPSTHADPYDL